MDKAPMPPSGEGPIIGAGVGYARSSSNGELVSFFRGRFFLPIALSVIVSAIALLLYRPPLRVLEVLRLAAVLGGVFLLISGVWKKRPPEEEDGGGDGPEDPDETPIIGEPLLPQLPIAGAGVSSESALTLKVRSLEDKLIQVANQLNYMEERFAELEQAVYYPQMHRPLVERNPRIEVPEPNRPKRPLAPPVSRPGLAPSSIDFQAVNQAVCRFLTQESGGWEIEQLIQSVQFTTDSGSPIEVQHLVPQGSGDWRLAALWLQRSSEGLVLVSSGELVDDDIARYFDVSFGRRISSCRQPARVSRSGNEVTVLQKGKVEISS